MTSTREALQSVVARLEDVIDQLPADPPGLPAPAYAHPGGVGLDLEEVA